MKIKYIGNLNPKYELKCGLLLQCPDCDNYWLEGNESYRYYHSLLNQNLQLTLDWNSSPPIANSEQKTILKQIKANPINSSGNNRDYIDFPVSCYFEDKWNDSCIVRFQKFPPFLSMFEYSMDFIRLDSVKDIRPSEFALPSVIRSFGDIDLELGLGDRPLLTYGPNQKFYAVWVGQNFFSLDGLKGSELNLESFLTKFPDKLVNYENSTLPKKYVIVDWDEEMNKYRA